MGIEITGKTGLRATIALALAACMTNSLALVPEIIYSLPSEDIRENPAATSQKESSVHNSPSPKKSPDNSTSMLERVVSFESEKMARERELYLQAEKALQKRHYATFSRLLPKLKNYPLYPYLRYQDIQRRIGSVSTRELSQFFTEFKSQPVAHSLKLRLLNYLGARGQWEKFLTFYTPQQNASLQCYHAYALIRTGNATAAYPEIEQLWQTGSSQPRNCDRVFNSWKAAGKLTPEMTWKRFELALDNGNSTLGRFLVRSLPPHDRKLAKTWVKLYRHPNRLPHYQETLLNSSHPKASRVLMTALKRLTSRYPQKAAEVLQQSDIINHLAEADYDYLKQSLAISFSRKQLPGAEHWFSQIPVTQLSNLGLEWRIRVALRESEWKTALNAINALPQTEQKSDRWRYWRARVLHEQGLESTAKKLFKKLAKKRSYYGFLAADRMNQPYSIKDNPHQPTADQLFVVVQNPGIQRARELFYLGRTTQARREWQYATSPMSNNQRINASKLAQLWGWAGQSILTMASTDSLDDIDLRFPLLLQDKVMEHSQRASIDPAWTYGVIRRESAFIPDARSNKGAIGLMQLMPATAKRISQSVEKVSYHNSSQLTQPDTNLALGTHYLNKMLNRFDGQKVLATAAYNAGATRVEKWLPKDNTLDAERWIENIPFKETREYVASVLAFSIIYADRLGMESQRLSNWMDKITPRNESVVKRDSDKEQLASLKDERTSLR